MCKSEIPEVPTQKLEMESLKAVDFDEALHKTGFGRFNYFLVILSGIVLSAVLLETLSISFVLPIAETDLDMSTADKGILSSAVYAGIIASSHLSGFLADTKGRRKVIMGSLLLSFLCTLISSLMNNFWSFTVLRFFCGFFISGSSTTIYAYLGEFHSAKTQPRVIMGAAFVFGIFCICVPLLALLVINQEFSLFIPLLSIEFKPWRLFVATCGSFSFFSGICFLFLPESPKFVHSQGDSKETLRLLKKVHRLNGTKESFDVVEIKKTEDQMIERVMDEDCSWLKGILFRMWHQTAPLFQKKLLKNTLLLCSIQFLIYITSAGFYMFFPEILNRTTEFLQSNSYSTTASHSTICQAIYATKTFSNQSSVTSLELQTYEYALLLEIIYAIGFALIGVLVNRLGKLPIITVVLAGCSLCAFAISLVSMLTLAIYLYVILLACGLSVNVVTTSTIELFPTSLRAMALSLSLMSGRLGSIFGSNITGLLLDNYCEFTFLFSGLSLALCCLLVFYIPNISYRSSRDSDNTRSSDTSAC